MTLTKEQREAMAEAARPLMKWISENCHPHCDVHVSASSVELTESVARMLSN